MRRNIAIFLAFLLASILQVYSFNLVLAHLTFSIPLTLFLLLPHCTRNQILVAVLGAALPLDYTSALLFGSYLLSFTILAMLGMQVVRRFPIRAHRLFHLAFIAGGSLVFFFSLFFVSAIAVVFALAPWSFALDRTIVQSIIQLLAWNTALAALAMILTRQAQRLLQRKFVLPHATP